VDIRHPSAGGNGADVIDLTGARLDRVEQRTEDLTRARDAEARVLVRLRDQMRDAREALPRTSVWRETLAKCEVSIDLCLGR
jgi:hypothetical protein